VGVGKQLKQANAARSRVVVFVGGEEEAQGKVKIKDMRSGEERLVPAADLAAAIASRSPSARGPSHPK
jgi:histidyl-tRNA synthetase